MSLSVEYSLPVFSVDVEFEVPILNPMYVVEMARWCIEEVVVVAQVFQNCFTGIPNYPEV